MVNFMSVDPEAYSPHTAAEGDPVYVPGASSDINPLGEGADTLPEPDLEAVGVDTGAIADESSRDQGETELNIPHDGEYEDEEEPDVDLDTNEVQRLINKAIVLLEDIEALAEELEVEPEVLQRYVEKKRAEIEEESDPATARPKSREPLAANPEATTTTMDPVQLFMDAAKQHRLLTAADEVMLAKRIEKGDLAAKER